MSKCNRCNIEIADTTLMCPLCKGVIENYDADMENEDFYSHSNMYPDVIPTIKRIKFVIKLFVFISVILEMTLILINYLTYNGVMWSAICGVALAYMCFTVGYSFQRNSGHRTKIIVQSVLAMILAVVIDYLVGYTGWALNYVVPVMIFGIDITILVLMLLNLSHWQNYIFAQVIMLLISIITLIFAVTGVVTKPLFTIIAASATGLILIGVLTFGDKKAFKELAIRFKI